MRAHAFLAGIGAVTRPTVHSAAELDAALRAVGCGASGTYPARTACVVRAVSGFAGQIDAVAAQAAAAGVSLGKSLTPVTSSDPGVRAAQQRLRLAEGSLSTTMIGMAPQMRAAAKDLRGMARSISDTMIAAGDSFAQMSQAWDVADASGQAVLTAEMARSRAWIVSYYDEFVIAVFDMSLLFAESAAKMAAASAALVDYRFAALADRSRALDDAFKGWKTALAGWQAALNVMNPVAAVGKGLLALPGAFGTAAGAAAGNALATFLKTTWPFFVGGFLLWWFTAGKRMAA